MKDVFTYREYCTVGSIGTYVSSNDHYYYHFSNCMRFALFFLYPNTYDIGTESQCDLHDVNQACPTVITTYTWYSDSCTIFVDQDDNDDSGRCRTVFTYVIIMYVRVLWVSRYSWYDESRRHSRRWLQGLTYTFVIIAAYLIIHIILPCIILYKPRSVIPYII